MPLIVRLPRLEAISAPTGAWRVSRGVYVCTLFCDALFCFLELEVKSGSRQKARDLESVKKDGSRKESEAILKSKR